MREGSSHQHFSAMENQFFAAGEQMDKAHMFEAAREMPAGDERDSACKEIFRTCKNALTLDEAIELKNLVQSPAFKEVIEDLEFEIREKEARGLLSEKKAA